MKRRLWVGAPLLLLAIASCDVSAPEEPNTGDKTVAKINDTAMNVYFVKIKSAAQKYRAVRGSNPATIDDLVAERFLDAPSARDPWGNPWVLETSGGQLIVTSYGADGVSGGTDAARDRISR